MPRTQGRRAAGTRRGALDLARHAIHDGSLKMMPRRSFMALAAAAGASSGARAAGAGGDDIFHVAIFRFTKENLDEAMAAFRALAAASRQEPGNIAYDIYRGIDDDLEFYIVEHWASPAALTAHERMA